jgi:hypothetical protein
MADALSIKLCPNYVVRVSVKTDCTYPPTPVTPCYSIPTVFRCSSAHSLQRLLSAGKPPFGAARPSHLPQVASDILLMYDNPLLRYSATVVKVELVD